MKYLYMVQMDSSTTDYDDISTFLYTKYADAYAKFLTLVTNEFDADNSWIGSEVIDEDGDVNKDYEFECDDKQDGKSDICWRIVDRNDYNRHTFIYLTKEEIIQGATL